MLLIMVNLDFLMFLSIEVALNQTDFINWTPGVQTIDSN